MTFTDPPHSPAEQATPELADVVADVVLAVPGVAGLHGGMFGEAGTYLPGRRVAGVRLGEDGADIHLSVVFGVPVRETAEAVRRAVAALVPGPVHVSIEDVFPAAIDSPTLGSST